MVFIFGTDPGDEDKRVLASAKPNLGPEPVSLAFEIESVPFAVGTKVDAENLEAGEDENHVGRLVFEGESDVSARSLIVGVRGSSLRSEKRSSAADWLVDYLRLGPRPVSELRDDAKVYGHSWRTIRRAADDLGILRSGGPGSVWELPEALREE